jgi:hypothetical protein
VSISKKEFQERAKRILVIEKDRVTRTEAALSQLAYQRELDELREHDPKLAELCLTANRVHMAALNNIVNYISKKVEN